MWFWVHHYGWRCHIKYLWLYTNTQFFLLWSNKIILDSHCVFKRVCVPYRENKFWHEFAAAFILLLLFLLPDIRYTHTQLSFSLNQNTVIQNQSQNLINQQNLTYYLFFYSSIGKFRFSNENSIKYFRIIAVLFCYQNTLLSVGYFLRSLYLSIYSHDPMNTNSLFQKQ